MVAAVDFNYHGGSKINETCNELWSDDLRFPRIGTRVERLLSPPPAPYPPSEARRSPPSKHPSPGLSAVGRSRSGGAVMEFRESGATLFNVSWKKGVLLIETSQNSFDPILSLRLALTVNEGKNGRAWPLWKGEEEEERKKKRGR